MNIKIYYIGKDNKYWKRLQDEFKSCYPDWQIEFTQLDYGRYPDFKNLFFKLYQESPQIIYIDYATNADWGIGLAKLLSQNEEMRLSSVVGLFDERSKEILDRSINASVKLNHIKCLEIEDVVYGPVSLINVDLPEDLELVQSSEMDKFEVYQPLRIGFIAENHFHVETNSYLPLGEILEVDHHPLEAIMPSKKVYVQKFYEHGLYFNKRFAYELEFIYKDNDFFASTNERWKLFKQLKHNPQKMEELGDVEKMEILRDMQERKEIFTPIKVKIDNWIKHHIQSREPKKLKILVVDASLALFKQVNKLDVDFTFSINFQTHLSENSTTITRFTPHLIAFDFSDERNHLPEFKRMLQFVEGVADYRPFILAFGLNSVLANEIKKLNLPHIITYQNSISSSLLIEMAERLDTKLQITEGNKKVFVRSKDKFSKIYIKRNIQVVSMTESILYFKSEIEIPLWTVFKVTSPLNFLITVVPHRKDSAADKSTYRALINNTSEMTKAKLRKLIYASLREDEDEV